MIEDVELFYVYFNGRWSGRKPKWIYDVYKFVDFNNAYRFFTIAKAPKEMAVKYIDCHNILSLTDYGIRKLLEFTCM